MSFQLPDAPRLLVEVPLRPVQGHRFQPTGFPDLGAAEYSLPDGRSNVLVESAQSVANRLEAACWDDATDAIAAPLAGLPYVAAVEDGRVVTTSLAEAHRINSPYLLDNESAVREALTSAFSEGDRPDLRVLAGILMRFDPNSLLHGVFVARKEIAGGRLRLSRALSGFIEAHDTRVAESGGVKNDFVNPSGDAAKGFGNVPFARTEYVAGQVVAYFNLDLHQIRGYRLGPDAEALLYALAVYKIRRFLHAGLRLRTACDLDADEPRVTRPAGGPLPSLAECEAALPGLIEAASSAFAEPRVTLVPVSRSAKKGKGK